MYVKKIAHGRKFDRVRIVLPLPMYTRLENMGRNMLIIMSAKKRKIKLKRILLLKYTKSSSFNSLAFFNQL